MVAAPRATDTLECRVHNYKTLSKFKRLAVIFTPPPLPQGWKTSDPELLGQLHPEKERTAPS